MILAARGMGQLGGDVLLPEVVDYMVGNQSVPVVEKEFGGVLHDANLTAYINEVGQSLAKVSKRPDWPYTFQILNNDTLNAFALPSGHIYVTKGLLKAMTNEAQLAAVLGHEVRHVSDRHGVKQLERSLGGNLLMRLASKAGWSSSADAQAVQGVLFNLLTSGYSRDHELDADSRAVDVMYRAGYHPFGAVQLMQLFQAMEGERSKDVEYYFRTHPLAKERVEELKDRINARYPLRDGKVYGKARYQSMVNDMIGAGGGAIFGGKSWLLPVGASLVVGSILWSFLRSR
jgi:predicted Zn-dependent protease